MVEVHQVMLHIKFHASEQSGSEEEGFLIFFYVFLWFEPRTPWPETILDPGTFIWTYLVKDYKAMLYTKFQASEPSGSEKEDFEYITMHFYGSNLGPLSGGPSCTQGPSF